MTYQIPPDPRYLNTFAVCYDCCDATAMLLWEKWHQVWGVSWQDESMGTMPTIGKRDGAPVTVVVTWATIAMKRVAFIEPSSMLVDHEMCDEWMRDVFPNAKHFVRPGNFAQIIYGISDALGVKTIVPRDIKNYRNLEVVVQTLPKDPDYLKPR